VVVVVVVVCCVSRRLVGRMRLCGVEGEIGVLLDLPIRSPTETKCMQFAFHAAQPNWKFVTAVFV
jgi:hypothetical protein